MTRLLAHVEGQTEETFVNEVLGPHLVACGYESVSARLIGARKRGRGGIPAWESARDGILKHMRDDRTVIVTTMIDYYGMPASGNRAWPGRELAQGAVTVEGAMFNDVAGLLGDGLRPDRFIPFVTMHEFEALLFSDCERFARGIYRPELEEQFRQIRNAYPTPEHINDSPRTHPSARVAALVAGYDKVLFGLLAMLELGIDAVRAECPHFAGWLTRLQQRLS